MNDKPNPSYMAYIPAGVRYSDALSASEKLLFGELTSLADQKGFAWPSNNYFAKLYKVSIATVSAWISNLKKAGFIRVEIAHETGNQRRIFIAGGIQGNRKTYSEKGEYPYSEKGEGNGVDVLKQEVTELVLSSEEEKTGTGNITTQSKPKRERKQQSVEDWIDSQRNNEAYRNLDLVRELGKMKAWLSTRRGRQLTIPFALNWLNRASESTPQSPIVGKPAKKPLNSAERRAIEDERIRKQFANEILK